MIGGGGGVVGVAVVVTAGGNVDAAANGNVVAVVDGIGDDSSRVLIIARILSSLLQLSPLSPPPPSLPSLTNGCPGQSFRNASILKGRIGSSSATCGR